jgi:hypothetical protein
MFVSLSDGYEECWWHVVKDHGDTLEICAAGGGFVYRVPAADVVKRVDELPRTVAKRCAVSMCDAEPYAAYRFPNERWNGWVCPWFTETVYGNLITELKKDPNWLFRVGDNPDGGLLQWCMNDEGVDLDLDENWFTEDRRRVDTEDGPITLISFGGFALCWDADHAGEWGRWCEGCAGTGVSFCQRFTCPACKGRGAKEVPADLEPEEVDRLARAIIAELTEEQIEYATDSRRGKYAGFAALHDLFDANMILPGADAPIGELAGWTEMANATSDRVTEILVGKERG